MTRFMAAVTCFLLLYSLLLVLPAVVAGESAPTLSPIQGPVGTHVTASASDWVGCTSMSVSGWGTTLATTTINSSGAFSLSFTVPSSAPLGAQQLLFSPSCPGSAWMPILTFTVTSGSVTNALADLSPTAILYNSADLVPGKTVFFDSGVQNSGSQGTDVFNVRWFVDDVSVGYGSHAGVPANSTVPNGNSQYSWPATSGTHTIKFAVDVDNHVQESNESNNSTSITVVVQTTPSSTIHCPDAPFIFPVNSGYIGWLYKVSTRCLDWYKEKDCKDKEGKPIVWIDSSQYHSGLDFWVSKGTPVMAQAAGYVSRPPTEMNSAPGEQSWRVNIAYPDIPNPKGGKGVEVYTNNLIDLQVSWDDKTKKGSDVSSGKVIGYAGSYEGHIHWSVGPYTPYPNGYNDQALIPREDSDAIQLDPTSFLTPKGNLNYATGAQLHWESVSLSWWCNGK